MCVCVCVRVHVHVHVHVHGFVNPTGWGVDTYRGEVIMLQLARRWLSWGNAPDMNTEVLLSRTFLWGTDCLADKQQLLRRMTSPHPPLRQFLHNPGTESLHVFNMFGFDGYCTNSLLKRVKVQSEVAYLNWHFECARQKHGIYCPSITVELGTLRREWKLWETD